MTNVVRRSSRLQEKAKLAEPEKSTALRIATHCSSDNSTTDNDSDFDVEEKISGSENRNKRKRRISGSLLREITKKQPVKRCKKNEKGNGKLKHNVNLKEVKRKRRVSTKTMNVPEQVQSLVPEMKKTNVMKDEKYGKRKAKSNLSDDATSSSCSDDEWENVDEMDFGNNESVSTLANSIEVTIKNAKMKSKPKETGRARYIKQHVNQKLRERKMNCHKMHLLCYIAHLRTWMETLLDNEDLMALCLSVIPAKYIIAAYHNFDIATAERFLNWFRETYRPAKKLFMAKNGSGNVQVERLENLIAEQVYENDRDLAFLLFLCIIALKQTARICLSCQPMPFKLVIPPSCLKHIETLINYYGNRKLTVDDYEGWPEKLEETVKKIVLFDEIMHVNSANNDGMDDDETKKTDKNDQSLMDKPRVIEQKEKRNYWVEYWDDNSRRWICLDPWKGSVDMPETMETDVTSPMHYVISIDNEYAMRDVTARYASKYLTPAVRRLWVNQDWWTETLKNYQSKNREHERLEDIAIQEYLFSKPKPVTVPEYKNHPLYVLEKDLSKYEVIYPEDQQPVGQIKGFDIYLRSSVQRLNGVINWMKELRSVKTGEKPYKVVQARTSNRTSTEYGAPKTVDLYGRWQTMPYVKPEVVNGRVPRNEFGNLYIFEKNMVPDGCVHLQLNGLLAVARRLNIDCVPAVVGWNHCRGGTHPILDGCVVLKEHEEQLREAWRQHYERKKVAAELKRTQRAIKNWRRLVKGLLTMKKVRAKFTFGDNRILHFDEKLENEVEAEVENNSTIIDDMVLAWPPTAFNLPGTSSES